MDDLYESDKSSTLKEEMHIRCDMEICEGCPYYYGEADLCMEGEDDVPDDLEKKCQRERKEKRYGLHTNKI